MRATRWQLTIPFAVGIALVGACSSTGSVTPGDGASAGGTTGTTGGAGGTKATGGAAGSGIVTGGGGTGIGIGGFDGGSSDALAEGCASISATATRVPLTIYLMMDRSSSMAGTKWDAAKAGVIGLVNDPGSKDVTVGLSMFPRDMLLPGKPECAFDNYQDALVDFGKLPGNAQKIVDAVNAASPNGYGTPIYPALGGGLTRALAIKQGAPNESVVVLLVTDGEPEPPPGGPMNPLCGQADPLDAKAIDGIAATALTMSGGVKTFVVGLPGVNVAFANDLAKAGGTDSAIVISNVDVQKQFQAALAKVRGEGLGCEFPLPPQADGKAYSYDQVNVRYTTGAGMAQDLSRSPGCKSGMGWDYDDPAKPTKVVLCSSVCDAVKADGLAKIDVVLGCPTILG